MSEEIKNNELEVKTTVDWYKSRMDLYCNIYTAIANHATASQRLASEWAECAVKDFDKVFNKPNGELK